MGQFPNFLDIPDIPLMEADVVILPIPYEATTSYGKGAANGPEAILKASRQVELYDPDLKDEIQNLVKIKTAEGVGERDEIAAAAGNFTDKFLVSLGGEHSITPELVKPFKKKYPDLSILQIDAHTDMRNEWEGSKLSHACAMRRVGEQLARRSLGEGGGIEKIVQVGIRNTALEEQQYLKAENIFWGDKFETGKVLEKLSDHVYLTFDVDGLDISIMPATGTPEPGGLSYKQALELLQAVAGKKNLVAADFVELAPIKGMPAYDFLVAKMIFKLLSFKFRT